MPDDQSARLADASVVIAEMGRRIREYQARLAELHAANRNLAARHRRLKSDNAKLSARLLVLEVSPPRGPCPPEPLAALPAPVDWRAVVPEAIAVKQEAWERHARVARVRATGETLRSVGAMMGLTQERVRQMVDKADRQPVSPVQKFLVHGWEFKDNA